MASAQAPIIDGGPSESVSRRVNWPQLFIPAFVAAIIPLVGVLMAFGAMQTRVDILDGASTKHGLALSAIQVTLAEIKGELKRQSDLKDSEGRVRSLEMRQMKSELGGPLNGVQAKVEQLLRNDSQQWPRLRTHGENIQILRRELEALKPDGQTIRLKVPEKF